MNLNDIPKFVINLPERTERLSRFDTDFNLFFPASTYQVIPAVRDKDIKKAITMSHQKAILTGYGHENILIMEDDVKFTSDKAYDYAVEAYKNVPDDFDILLGGIYQGKPLKSLNEPWCSVDLFSALHFYVINKRAYDKVLNFDGSVHIDRWMGPNLKCYVCDPMFAVQYDGYSDQIKKVTDYGYLLKKFKFV